MTRPTEIVELFLAGARVVSAAVADPAVAQHWDRPSVLEDQRVGGLAGHLARGAVWVVGDYLDAGPPDGTEHAVDFASAADYFATLMSEASPDDHRAIRARGADLAAAGHDALVHMLRDRLEALEPRLRSVEAGLLVSVIGGRVMALDDYLITRIVEQVVHVDDLARSVDHDPWLLPSGAAELAVTVGIDVARCRSGATALVRALYRHGFAGPVLPVL